MHFQFKTSSEGNVPQPMMQTILSFLMLAFMGMPAFAGDLIFYDGFEGNPPPIVTLALAPANPQTTFGSVSVEWNIENAFTSCTTQDNGVPPTEWQSQGPIATATGSRSVSLDVQSLTFSIDCTGPGGSDADAISINFGAPPELLITTNTDPVEDSTVLTFSIAVSNPTPVVRSGVVLDIVVPEFMSLTPATETSPPGECEGGSASCSTGTGVRWNLGNLAPGAVKVVRISDIISSSATDGDFITLDAQVTSDGVADVFGSKTVPVTESAPALQVAIANNRDPAQPGDLVSFEVRYSNRSESPNAITADSLTVTLPSGLSFVSADPGGTENEGVLSWPLTLAAGSNGIRGFVAQVGADQNDGALLETEALIEDSSSGTTALATNVLPVEDTPALDLNISSSVDSVEDSTVLTFSMTVSNPGSATQTNVVLEALIPGYMSIVAATESIPAASCSSGSASCSTGTGIRWLLGNLAPGESKVVHLSDIISSSADDGELLTLAARATSDDGSDVQDSRTVLVSESAPSLQLGMTADRNEAAPGDLVVFSLRLTNRSVAPDAVTADTLRVALPTGLEFVSASDGGTASSGGISWDLTAASGSKALRRFTARVAAGLDDGTLLRALARLQSSGGRGATASYDLAISSDPVLDLEVISSVDAVEDSTALTFTMTVSNPSDATQTNVTLEALIPGYMSIVAGTESIPPAACASGSSNCSIGTGLRWQLGSLAPGESKVIRFSDIISSSGGDGELLTLAARASSDSGSDAKETQVVVISESAPQLQLSMTPDRSRAGPGDLVTFSVRTSNRSEAPSAISADTLRVTLPEEVTFVSATDGGSETDGVVSWPISEAAGENGSRLFQVEVGNGLADGTQIRVQAVLQATSANAAATADSVFVVDPTAALGLAATGSLDAIEDGTNITYTMTVTNPSIAAQTNVVLEALIPGYMSIISGTESIPPAACLSGSANCSTATGLRWALGDLDPGESRVVKLSDVLTTSASAGELLNLATRLSADSGPDEQDTHAIVVGEAAPPLQMGLAGDRGEAAPGDQVAYTLRFSNRSAAPNALTADRLRVLLPEGLSFVSASDGGTESDGVISWSLSSTAGTNDERQFTVEVENGETAGQLLPLSAQLIDDDDAAAAVAESALAVVAAPALELTAETSVDPVVDGTELTITLTVTNASAQPITNATVEFLIPGYMSIVTASETNPPGACLSGSSNCSTGTGIRWDLGTLAASESAVITITDTLSSSAADGEILNINARASGDDVADAKTSFNIVILED